MSKIGEINFDLQEQAEELGFESVQEALDNGYHAYMGIDGNNRLIKAAKPSWDVVQKTVEDVKALAEAHADYENRKKIIVDKLEMLISDTPYKIYEDTLKEAIEFIKEKEV